MGLSKLTDDELERIAYGRFRWETDIIARVGPAGRVAIDPTATSVGLSCCGCEAQFSIPRCAAPHHGVSKNPPSRNRAGLLPWQGRQRLPPYKIVGLRNDLLVIADAA